MHAETAFILLFIVATTVAIAARRFRIPYTVALVLAGLILGAVHAIEVPHLTRELLFSLFLPGLLFEAAFHIEFREIWRNRLTITGLAVPGVVAAMVLTAVALPPVADALQFVQGFGWRHALVFGALIAATDPIAVVALFRRLGAPKRLTVLTEGESLFNDGTAIVFFTLALGLFEGQGASGRGLLLDFVSIVGVGVLIGVAVGFAVSQVLKQINEPMIEITLTTIAAYGSFVAAEHFHYSGVIATVVAGMLCGNYGAPTGMSPTTRVAVETFWEYVAFALNSIVFLLIGFEVRLEALLASWLPILAAYLVVTFGRALVVGAVTTLLSRSRERIPVSWSVVLTWGGLRGALSMVLALSLPPAFPHRDLLVTMTFGVVILSILVHGLTMAPLLRRLGVIRDRGARSAYELRRGALQAAHTALVELDRMPGSGVAGPDALETVREEYRRRAHQAETALRELHLERKELAEEERHWARRHLLLVEKQQVLDAFRQGVLGAEAQKGLLADIDARLLRLETAGEDAAERGETPGGGDDPAGAVDGTPVDG
jgi:Na+:H+ antiporter